jgi:hypothetical protein
MLSAIELDCETERGTIEIKHVGTDRMLSPEAQTINLVAPQRPPEVFLGVRHFSAQSARTPRHRRSAGESRPPPSRCAADLPLAGGGET